MKADLLYIHNLSLTKKADAEHQQMLKWYETKLAPISTRGLVEDMKLLSNAKLKALYAEYKRSV